MLACDLVLEVRATRSLSYPQVARLERELSQGFDRNDLDLLLLLDRYAERADPAWPALLARAVAAAAGDTAPSAHPSLIARAA